MAVYEVMYSILLCSHVWPSSSSSVEVADYNKSSLCIYNGRLVIISVFMLSLSMKHQYH